MTLKSGSHLGPYEILEPIGAGGMGEVFRARDPRLGRDVAIKVLPSAFAEDGERLQRFEREARALAALSHPNVLAIYDVGTHEGAPYLVMELLRGQTLRERLLCGPLPSSTALELGIMMARGLAAAHERGIVHRDLKPANVLLTADGSVKILDFGLAKQRELLPPGPLSQAQTRDAAEVTRAGVVLGSVGYMSPEQVRGEGVDARSDIFALGVLLYEMICGHRAFRRETPADTLSAILKEDPPGLETIGGSAFPGLALVLKRCLEKRREDRFSGAQDVALALQALAGPPSSLSEPPAPGEKSIVVLPFQNLSPDPDNAYFADGLTEELIADLSKVKALRVISRTSAMRYRGSDKSVPQIAQELKVRHVLEGSVRRAGNSLRITAQLIEAATDAHLWAEKYTGTLDDIFDVQERLSTAIVSALRVQLSLAEEAVLKHRGIPDAEVYADWLRARHLVRTYVTEGAAEAISRLEAGLKRVGDNPQVMAGLAMVHCHLGVLGPAGEDALDRAESWATRALQLDPAVAQAHVTRAILAAIRGQPRLAVDHLEKAQASAPGDWETHHWLTYVYLGVGRHEKALHHAHALVAIDPAEPLSKLWLAFALLYDGRTEEAHSVLESAASDRTKTHPRFILAWAYAWQGRRQSALELLDLVEACPSYDYTTQLCLLLRDALKGDKEAFARDLTPDLVRSAWVDAWGASFVAECCCLLGDLDAALHWLDRAASWGWFSYPLYAHTDPFFEPLRGDPRFHAFLERVKEQWERFEA